MVDYTQYDNAVREIAPQLQYAAEFVPLSKSRNAGEKYPTLNWRVAFSTNGTNGLTSDYSQGVAHLPNYEHRFDDLVIYDNAVREAAETGKSRLRSGQKNGYDACQADKAHSRHAYAPIPNPSISEVLHCLLLDSEVLDYGTFEEWADNFGYDPDSRKAEKIYRDCLETGLKLRNMLGDETLAKLREALQDM